MSKFKVGDKVISIMNTPQQQEGFIGVVDMITGQSKYSINVRKEGSDSISVFAENELTLLRDKVENASSALDKQVSGNHYKDCKIQPVEYIQANDLDYLQGNVIKYVTRHKLKNGKADIEKAVHYLELILELQYGE